MADIDFDSVWVLKVLWLVLLAAGLGAIGGFARYLRGREEPAKRETATSEAELKEAVSEARWAACKAILSSVFLGAIAAIAAFYVLAPATALKMIAACLISGYAGPTILDALELRFKLMVAEEKAKTEEKKATAAESKAAAAESKASAAESKADRAVNVGEAALGLLAGVSGAASIALPQGQPLPTPMTANLLAVELNSLRERLDTIKQGRNT